MDRKNFIVVSLISTIFIVAACLPDAAQKNEADDIVVYSGFKEIDLTKNHFILIGDTQNTSRFEFWRERNDRERQLIINELARREPAFVIHLGDLTVRGSSKKHWSQFDQHHKGLRDKKIPYFPILGNHEFYGNDERALQNYFERFPHLDERRWYRLTWKKVAIIMLDSNFSTLTKEQTEEQSRWYLSELEKCENDKNVEYVIVCCHGAPFTNSRVVTSNKKAKMYFADPFMRFQKTRLFFSGHCHSYERFQVDSKFFIVSGGGGGPRHKVSIDPSRRSFKDLFTGPEIRFFHFCEIKLSEGSFAFRVLGLEANEAFTAVDPLTITYIKRIGR